MGQAAKIHLGQGEKDGKIQRAPLLDTAYIGIFNHKMRLGFTKKNHVSAPTKYISRFVVTLS